MTLKVSLFIKPKKDYSLENIYIDWTLNMTDKEDTIIINTSGSYDILAKYYSKVFEIENAPTHYHKYYWPFHELTFTNVEDGKFFTLMCNRINTIDMKDNKLYFEFTLHPNEPLFGFDLQHPITSGTALISAENEKLDLLIEIFSQNLLIDNKYPIVRCNQCNGLMTVHANKKPDDILYANDFICVDCLKAVSTFYNLLYSEIQATLDEDLKEKLNIFLQYIEGGMKAAIALKDYELKCFYDLLLLQTMFKVQNFTAEETEIITEFYKSKIKGKKYKKFESELENFKKTIAKFKESLVANSKNSSQIEVIIKNKRSSKNTQEVNKEENIVPVLESKDEITTIDNTNGNNAIQTPETTSQMDESIEQELKDSVELILKNKNNLKENIKNDNEDTKILDEMADAIMLLSTIESDLEPKPITPVERLKTAIIEENEIKKPLKPSERFSKNLPDIEEINLINQNEESNDILIKNGEDAWKDVEESINALDELIGGEEDNKEKKIENIVTATPSTTNPPPGVNPPPNLRPPPGVNPPPNLRPPPGVNPPPNLHPPPGVNPLPVANPPPNLHPPPKSKNKEDNEI